MSHVKLASAALAMAALLAVGCQKQTAGPSVSAYQKERQAAIERSQKEAGAPQVAHRKTGEPGAEAAPAETAFGKHGANYAYDPVGKRDPFRSFILDRIKERGTDAKSPLEQFDLSQLQVTGVVWETDRRRALVLDPSGQNYIVQEGDPIGKNDGRVIGIGDSSVLVREAYVDFHGEKTTKEIEMRVRQSQGG